MDNNANGIWLMGFRPASQCVLVSSSDENSTETTHVTIGVTGIKAPRRTAAPERTDTQMWVQISEHTQTQTYTMTHTCPRMHTYRHNNYITLHPSNKKIYKKWNSTVPNVLFLNKNAYRGLKRSVLRSKSLFCFNHVWVLLLLNTDIHTYQGNEDTKTPRTPTTSRKHLMWPITRLWECECGYMNVDVAVCLCVWVSPYQYRL